MNITKAVIPAAGLGTRFLPYTKAIPKEMLPIHNKPAIQLIIEEGIASHIKEFNIILNDDKQAIKQHFSRDIALEEKLKNSNKESLLNDINTIIETTHFNYIPQPIPYGLGHAILMAHEAIGHEYFSVFLPDEIMVGQTPAIAQLISIAQKYNASVIGVQKVPREKVSAYGIIESKKQLGNNIFEVANLIEKPSIQEAPSDYAIIGRYVLSPRLFNSLQIITPGTGNEIQLTDGIRHMMDSGEKVIAYVIESQRYDIGTPPGWLNANMHI